MCCSPSITIPPRSSASMPPSAPPGGKALEPVRQAVRRCFGGIGEQVAAGVELRHDNGSQYISEDFQDEIAFLGLRSSPAFVRAPEGNGCVERAIRTLKEQLLWVRTFETVEERIPRVPVQGMPSGRWGGRNGADRRPRRRR